MSGLEFVSTGTAGSAGSGGSALSITPDEVLTATDLDLGTHTNGGFTISRYGNIIVPNGFIRDNNAAAYDWLGGVPWFRFPDGWIPDGAPIDGSFPNWSIEVMFVHLSSDDSTKQRVPGVVYIGNPTGDATTPALYTNDAPTFDFDLLTAGDHMNVQFDFYRQPLLLPSESVFSPG